MWHVLCINKRLRQKMVTCVGRTWSTVGDGVVQEMQFHRGGCKFQKQDSKTKLKHSVNPELCYLLEFKDAVVTLSWYQWSGGKNSLNPGVLSEPIRRLLENHVSPWLVSTLNISFYIKSHSAMFNAKSQWDFNYSAPLNTDGTKVLPFF